MKRVMRAGLITAFATTIGLAGVAFAQQSPSGGGAAGDTGGGDMGGGDFGSSAPAAPGGTAKPAATNTTMPGNASGLYPMEEVARPLQLPKGELEAGATIPITDGPSSSATFSFGSWIGFNLRGDYGITDKIQAGLRIPLLIVKPDLTGGLGGGPAAFGGVLVDGMYGINDMLSVHVDVGDVRAGGIAFNDAVYPAYNIGDLKVGLRAGVSFKKRFLAGKLAVLADPALEYQLDSAADSNGGQKAFIGLRIPVAALYQIQPALAAGIRTGIYTGYDVSFSADHGATIPVLLEGQYTMMNGNLDLGADLGFGSLLTGNAMGGGFYDSVGHSLYLGIFGAWRMAGLQ